MPAGTPGWGGQLDWAPGEAQVWRLGRATECRLASDWAQGRGWGTAMGCLVALWVGVGGWGGVGVRLWGGG